MIIGIDFDGTCVYGAYPNIGREIGAPAVLRRLVAAGHQLILWTVRDGKNLEEAARWFQQHDIPLFGVNHRPDQPTSSPKVRCDLYIDDAALGAPVVQPEDDTRIGDRAYIDWHLAEIWLEQTGVLPETYLPCCVIGVPAGTPPEAVPDLRIREVPGPTVINAAGIKFATFDWVKGSGAIFDKG